MAKGSFMEIWKSHWWCGLLRSPPDWNKRKINFFLWPLLLTTELCLNLLAFLSVLLQVSMGFFFSKRKAANWKTLHFINLSMFSEKKQQKICGFLDGAFIHIIQTFKRHYYKWAVMFILYAQLIHIRDTYIESKSYNSFLCFSYHKWWTI